LMSELAIRRGDPLRLPPALRIALRELQGGLRGFYVFMGCIALGVMTIASVGSFSRGVAEGLAREGRVILGGDLSFSLIQREATPAERVFLSEQGSMTTTAMLRAMARRSGNQGSGSAQRDTALVEVKAIDAAYPLYGELLTQPG